MDGRRELHGGLSGGVLRLVADHVETNLVGGLSLAALADLAQVSPRHFLRLFKTSTGISPHQHVIRARVERAEEHVTGWNLSLAAVAAAFGFPHQQHLTRHFTRLVGVGPRRYRKLSSR